MTDRARVRSCSSRTTRACGAILARHLRSVGLSRRRGGVGRGGRARRSTAGLRPALVLLDINLPGDTGWDLLRGPALAAAGSPPVVVASATTVSPRRLAEFGVAGYLPKPFPLETLVATIERLLDAGGGHEDAMTDLQILLIVAGVRRWPWPATWCCATGCAR